MKMDPFKKNFVVDIVPNSKIFSTKTTLLKDGGKHLACMDHSVRIHTNIYIYIIMLMLILYILYINMCIYIYIYIYIYVLL
jgi:hypothetical protein